MLRLTLLVFLLTHRIQTAHVTDSPSYVNRLDRLYEKLEKLTIAPDKQLARSREKLYKKLDRLNALSPDRLDLTEDDEELLSAMQAWGFSPEQVVDAAKDLQRMKEDIGIDQEYGDSDWNDEDSDIPDSDDLYANDDWDPEELADSSSTAQPQTIGLSPLANTKQSSDPTDDNVDSAAASLAFTNARPRIIPVVAALEKATLRRAALHSTSSLLRNRKCLEPQPRWLTVRQLAPAADTVYMPPCVQLHRCAPDAGCCINESEVCAPLKGRLVAFPLFLQKADGTVNVVKMQFFNHTKCTCVSREKLQNSMTVRAGQASYGDGQEQDTSAERDIVAEGQNDWRTPTEEPRVEKEEEVTAPPPQLRSNPNSRCTCPGYFLASMTDTEPCSCVCEWPDAFRRQACQSLARGKEHFGLRDRVCVARGDCTQPTCQFGAYDRTSGQCPLRRFRRVRFHRGRYQPEKTVVV